MGECGRSSLSSNRRSATSPSASLRNASTRLRPAPSTARRNEPMKDLGSIHVESFLEMMSAERGAAVNTLQSYERDLNALRSFLNGRGVKLLDAASPDLSAYLG